MGLNYQDLRHMPYHRLMWALDEWRRMNERPAETKTVTRAATQSDIVSILY